jgi:hypothetical protein
LPGPHSSIRNAAAHSAPAPVLRLGRREHCPASRPRRRSASRGGGQGRMGIRGPTRNVGGRSESSISKRRLETCQADVRSARSAGTISARLVRDLRGSRGRAGSARVHLRSRYGSTSTPAGSSRLSRSPSMRASSESYSSRTTSTPNSPEAGGDQSAPEPFRAGLPRRGSSTRASLDDDARRHRQGTAHVRDRSRARRAGEVRALPDPAGLADSSGDFCECSCHRFASLGLPLVEFRSQRLRALIEERVNRLRLRDREDELHLAPAQSFDLGR